MGFDGFQLSLAGPLSTGLDEPALLKHQGADLIFQSGASRSTPARISAALRPMTTSSCHWRCRIDALYRPQTTPIFSKVPRPGSTRPADLKFAPFKNTCEKSGLATVFLRVSRSQRFFHSSKGSRGPQSYL